MNAVDVKTMNYDDVMGMLHSTQEPVEFSLRRLDTARGSGNDSSQSDTSNLTFTSSCSKSAPLSATFSNQQIKKPCLSIKLNE